MTAVVLAIGVMIFAAKPIDEFVEEHPTVKMLTCPFPSWWGWPWSLKEPVTRCPRDISILPWPFLVS